MILMSILLAVKATAQPAYKNPALSLDERVDDLIKRMTLEEKVAQLQGFRSGDTLAFDAEGNYVGVLDTAMLNRGAGTFASRGLFRGAPRERMLRTNGLQRYMLEKSQLGIPVLRFGESLHGFMSQGATSFPQAIALGCTWDTLLVEEVFTAAALEARSQGVYQVLSPVLDLARDPRWGRTEECYGEDPYHVAIMGKAAVFGFQGRGKTVAPGHVAVTLKHFAGHGQPEGGRNIAPLYFSDRMFRETHLYPFEVAVKKANAQSIMVSYNEWDGVPNHVNSKLLKDILRDEWGFKGYVMSDGGGLDVTYRDHKAAADSAESGALSVMAGVDYDLGSRNCFRGLVDQVKKGFVSEAAVTRAARSVLRVKLACGLFENPYVDADPDEAERASIASRHKKLALKAAHEAMVLLKNDGNTLPFDPAKIKTLAVIGPVASEIHLGGYSPTPMHGVSVLQGIKDFAAGKFEVRYAEGCKITLNKECHWVVNENPVMSDPEEDKKRISEAVKTAKKSDAVILVIGENELINREAWSREHLGDRDNLDLAGMQAELALAVLAAGKPVAVILINGRPISLGKVAEKAGAIVECWYLGQETGHAVADLVFGNINPSGKLSVTFPRSVGQLPCYYNRKPSLFREYVLAESTPLYPFGFGLSYTSFEYVNLTVTPEEITPCGSAEVSVDVANRGNRAGDEIVQVYIRDLVSLPTRPVMELKDFVRVHLEPGQVKTLTFRITPEKLEAYDLEMRRRVQAGDFEILVGGNSRDVLKGTLTVK
jgi:beta-glucosidase